MIVKTVFEQTLNKYGFFCTEGISWSCKVLVFSSPEISFFENLCLDDHTVETGAQIKHLRFHSDMLSKNQEVNIFCC